MHKDEIRQTVREAVRETFKNLGLDPDSPREMQSDLIYLRKLRKGSEFLSIRARLHAMAILIPTMLYLLWESIKNAVNK